MFIIILLIGSISILVNTRTTIPEISTDYWFFESFQRGNLDNWIRSEYENPDETAKYDGKILVSPPVGKVISSVEDFGLLLSEPSKHYGVCSPIIPPLDNNGRDLIFQYEVKYETYISCGGAYLKLLQPMKDYSLLNENSPYHILFGPDFCGDTNAVKLIINYKNPKTNTWEEKHHSFPPLIRNDPFTHLYTLKITPSNNYQILIDREIVREGSILEDLTPPILPSKMIDNPSPPPASYDERETISDPIAPKPEDWDENEPMFIDDPSDRVPDFWLSEEPTTIPDQSIPQPEGWDEEQDGVFSPPEKTNPKCIYKRLNINRCGRYKPQRIKNPKYRGKWNIQKINNPNYMGRWTSPKIKNPHFFEDDFVYHLKGGVGAVGIDLWTVNENIMIDNILVTWNSSVAEQLMDIWSLKHKLELEKTPMDLNNIGGNYRKMKSEWSEGMSILGGLKQFFFKPFPMIMICLLLFFVSVFCWCCYCICKKDSQKIISNNNKEEEEEEESNDELIREEEEEKRKRKEKKDDDDDESEIEDSLKYFKDEEEEDDDDNDDIIDEEDML